MRRLRILTAIPLVAGLLFAGAATASAQTGIPGIPSVPGLGDLPYVNAGFPCFWPDTVGDSPTLTSDNIGATNDSFVFLMSSQTQPPAPTQPGMGQLPDLSFMKCFFHYSEGAESPSRIQKNFFCDYRSGSTSPISSGQQVVYHVFEHSTLIVRDQFAILLCWGTATA